MFGSAAGQAISLVLLPILSRTIKPEHLGEFSITMVFVMVFNSIIALKMDGVLLASNQDDKTIYTRIGIASASIISLTIMFLLVIALFFGANFDIIFFILTVGALLSFSLSQLCSSYSLSIGDFSSATKHRFSRTTLTLIIQIALCINYPSGNSLIFGYIMANIAAIFMFNSWNVRDILHIPSFKQVKVVVYDKWDFVIYQNLSGVFSIASQYIMNLSLVYFSGSSFVGIYSMTTRVMQAPITLVTSSVKDAFYYKVKKISDRSEVRRELKKITIYMFLPAFLASILVFPFLPGVFSFVFGDAWYDSGVYAQILLPWFVMLFINQPYTATGAVIGIQKKLMKFDAFSFLTRVVTVVLSWLIYDDIYITLISFSVLGVLLNAALIRIVYRSCF